jgi:cell division protein FtsI (penicillin-binding protein 3)
MRKMMEGVVLFGSGRPAQLSGYSAGGKTGTAQKIDPVTHLYSKTMHNASFAGIAPVNNPVISIAVIMDNPRKGPSYYGTAVSAPVFAEVAQQVLEYLGVPHDTEVRPLKAAAKPEKPIVEDDSDDADINALYAAANDLPSDDPLRAPQPTTTQTAASEPKTAAATAPAPSKPIPAPDTKNELAQAPPPQPVESPIHAQPELSRVSIVTEDKSFKVPSLVGLPLRKVIELSAAAGLEVQTIGSGTAREQAPAPGTMVARGTQIVVKCAR